VGWCWWEVGGVCVGAFAITQTPDLPSYPTPTPRIQHPPSYPTPTTCRDHLVNHVSLARKVNAFIASRGAEGGAVAAHGRRMDSWLGRLELQLQASMVRPPQRELPDATDLYEWTEAHMRSAMSVVPQSPDDMTYAIAVRVQMACILGLAVGQAMPPCRLNLIKTWNHPDHSAHCGDPDCRDPDRCQGNRLVVLESGPVGGRRSLAGVPGTDSDNDGLSDSDSDYLDSDDEDPYGFGRSIRSVVVHGKTERSAKGCNLTYTLPRGLLTRLLMVHITVGHGRLTNSLEREQPRLFVTVFGKAHNHGQAWQDSPFCQAFRKIIDECPLAPLYGIKPFPPSVARTVFVEDYLAGA
jgi:hypothetical protein